VNGVNGVNGGGSASPPSPPTPSAPSALSALSVSTSSSIKRDRDVEIEVLYTKFRRNDVSHCRDYLLSRGICEGVINHLCERGVLVHNKYEGNSYCCFAVFDHCGRLRCLDNHQIGGEVKFVLGGKHPFSLDWKALPLSHRVFVTESIIDYLSIKTLEGFSFRGLALLGKVINFNSDLFSSAREIVSALDGDDGGFRAFLDLEESFSDRVLQVYDFGDSKDANEYLQKQKIRKVLKQLSAQDKLSLYRDYQRSDNKSTVAVKWGINRSYMYEIVNECEELILSGFSQRRRGRKSSGEPATMAEARERVASLEQENRRLDEERERYYVRNEFMKLRLKWAEGEGEGEGEGGGEAGEGEAEFSGDVAPAPGDTAADNPAPAPSVSKNRNRKKHLKKKRRRKW
jgi:transposase-like protein